MRAVTFQQPGRVVHDLVDRGLDHSFQGVPVVFRQMTERLQRFFQFRVGDRFHFAAQGHDGGDDVKVFIPFAKADYRFIDDAFRFGGSTNRPGRWFHKSRAPPLLLHIKMLMFRRRGF